MLYVLLPTPSDIRIAFPGHHTPFFIFSVLRGPKSQPIGEIFTSAKPVVIPGHRSRRRNWRGVCTLNVGGGRLGVGIRRSRGPASRAKTGRVENGIVHVDETVTDPVFNR